MSTEPFDDILNRAKGLSPDERRRLIEELSKSVGTNGDSGDGPTLFDALNDRGIIGSIADAPPDLSTNPDHMQGFGQQDD